MFLGTRRIKCLKAFAHWVRDFYRASSIPSLVGLSEETFKRQMDRAAAREIIRRNMIRKTKTSAEGGGRSVTDGCTRCYRSIEGLDGALKPRVFDFPEKETNFRFLCHYFALLVENIEHPLALG